MRLLIVIVSPEDCPDTGRAVVPEAEDDPYTVRKYYFPDFDKKSCAFGRDFPAWYASHWYHHEDFLSHAVCCLYYRMGISGYEKSYLFSPDDGDLCCRNFFAKSGTACPYVKSDQEGYYWETYYEDQLNSVPMPVIYNHTYYPDINAGTCVNGTDYPEWMSSDADYKRFYLFKEPEGCCKKWFEGYNFDNCLASIIQVMTDLLLPKLHTASSPIFFCPHCM